MKTIILTHKAAKELDAIPEPSRTAIADSLHCYAIAGEGDVKRLTGRDGYRLRVGACRVIFAEDATTVLAIFVGRRTTTTY